MRSITGNRTMKKMSLAVLSLFFVVGLLAPFLANEKQILIIDQKNEYHFFPNTPIDSANILIGPFIPYSPQNIDIEAMGAKRPFGSHQNHWLGTDLIGRDILSAIIWGAQTSLLIGLLSTLIAGFLGILIGGVAGYLGNSSVKISRARLYFLSILSVFLIFYHFHLLKVSLILRESLTDLMLSVVIQLIIVLGLFAMINLILHDLEKRMRWKKTPLPVDGFLSRLIEIVSTLPILFIIITLSALLRPSIWNVILIIGLTGWTGIARYTRAEFLSLKKQNFILSAKSLGLPIGKILFRHMLPNAYSTLFTALAFAFAAAILAETTLSFLGVGLPPDQPSWGSVLAMARQNPSAWWMVVFPSLCIFLLIFSLQYLATYYTNASRK